MSRRALQHEAPAGLILCIGDVDPVPFTSSVFLWLRLIGPGANAAELAAVRIYSFISHNSICHILSYLKNSAVSP